MAGVRGRAAVDVDDADLAVLAPVVLLEQPLQRHRRGGAVVEVGQRRCPCRRRWRPAWVAMAPTPATAAGTADPTARNFDATATPHDSPSADLATIENVMARRSEPAHDG